MPSIRSENTHVHSIRGCRLVDRPLIIRGSRGARRVLPSHVHGSPDADELRCLDLIRHFHCWNRRNAIRAVKYVVCPVLDGEGRPLRSSDGRPRMRRYIWEVACFQKRERVEWKLVTWGIDEVSVSFQTYKTGKATMAAFRQPPEPVRAQP